MNNHNLLPFSRDVGTPASGPFDPSVPPPPIARAAGFFGSVSAGSDAAANASASASANAPASAPANAYTGAFAAAPTKIRAAQQEPATDAGCDEIAQRYRDALDALNAATSQRSAAGSADACLRLGHCLIAAGELDGALARLETGLQTYRALGDVNGELATLQALAGIHRAQGRYPNVMALLQDFLPLVPADASDAQRDFFIAGIAEGHAHCAVALLAQGRPGEARAHCNQGLGMLPRCSGRDDPPAVNAVGWRSLDAAARLYLVRGQPAPAVRAAIFLLRRGRLHREESWIATACDRCADLRAAQGRLAHAARWLNRSWRRWARLGRHREQTLALDRLADAHAALGHHREALHASKAARGLENEEHIRQARLRSALAAIERDADRSFEAQRGRQIGPDELAHLTRLADIGRMVTCIAHEVTQPLAAIRLVAENAADGDTRMSQPAQPSRSQKGLVHVVQLVDQLTVYVEQLKRFTRRDAVRVDPVQLSTIVAEALAIVEPRRKSRNVTLSFALNDVEVLADASRARGILVNLLCNAFDAVAGGASPKVLLMSRVAGDRAVLEVRDHGGGLSDHDLAHLFEPFHTTKPAGQGTGLGLKLAMDLSTSMGANLEGANHPEGGALFTLDMPLAPASVSVSASVSTFSAADRPMHSECDIRHQQQSRACPPESS